LTVTKKKKNGYTFIGVIHSRFPKPEGTPIQPAFSDAAPGTIEIYPEFAAGLKDLEGFERIWLLYHLHLVSGMYLTVKPFLDVALHGIFATRSPARPNPIGLSAVRLIGIQGRVLSIEGLDVIDDTPLLDIKPYMPKFDAYPESRAGWFETASGGVTRADDRFMHRKEKP